MTERQRRSDTMTKAEREAWVERMCPGEFVFTPELIEKLRLILASAS